MAKLEAMLEQRGIATPREMSEAVARCQLHGGDLTTSLLQFVSADETQLSAALSECYELPAAGVGLLPAPDDAALRSLPRDVAERYCCFPLEATPGRLVLAVAHPLEPALREELGFTLGVSIEERVALEVRIRQALSRFYGLPLSARNQRGIARLEGDVEGAGHETPLGIWPDAQLSTLPRPPSELTAARDSQRPPSVRPRSRSETPRYGTGSTSPSGGGRTSRRRGPLTLAQAREELTRAGTRNDVLDIFFGFASQFFEYSALFAVHNALAEGLDAWGKGADRETVLGIGVPLDLPSSLSEVAESCKVRLTRLGKEGIDRTLAADLQRQSNAKALVLPVSLRGRCAVLLYADSGEADVVEREVADVIAIAPDVANALGRIILQRKKDVARQKSPENTDLSALARRSQLPDSSSTPSNEPGRVPSLLDALEPIPNESRERSRNNARRSSRPDASPRPLRPDRDDDSVSARPVLAIGPSTDGASPSPAPAGDVGPRSDPNSGEDPVFLLARPQDRVRMLAMPSEPRPMPIVARPPVSITHPAPIIGSRPRLPSVIVEPDSTDPEASERLTRAAAVTRAPTQARNGPARRPLVPLLADAPRTLSPPVHERPAAKRARPEEPAPSAQPLESQNRQSQDPEAQAEGQDRENQDREAHSQGPQPSQPEATSVGLIDAEPASPRPALHPASIELSEPPPALESYPLESNTEASEGEPARAEAEQDDEDDLPPPSSDAWPPLIMDHSPPPRQPPLTALVPIIIADPPKGRRGYTSRTAATARPGNRPGIAKSALQRAPSASPPAHGGPASPTAPSPSRARKLEPAANGPIASAKAQPAPIAPAPITPIPIAVTEPNPLAINAAASADMAAAAVPTLGEAVLAAPAANAAANGGSRLTNAIARAAARAAGTSSPRANDPLVRADDARIAAATTAPPSGARENPTPNAFAAESPARRDSRPPPAPASFARSSASPPPLQTRASPGASTPRLVLPSRSGERASRPPPAPTTLPAPRDARSDLGRDDPSFPSAAVVESSRASAPSTAPSSTILGLGVASVASAGFASAPSEESAAAPPTGSSTLIGVAAILPAAASAVASNASATGGASLDAGAGRSASEPAASTDSPTPRALRAPGFGSAPPRAMLAASAGDDAPPDSVELAWDALISEPPPAGASIASSQPPAAAAEAAAPTRPAPSTPSMSTSASAASEPGSTDADSRGDASRPSQPPSSMPFARSASAPPASSAAPSSPIHPVPSRPMSASSSDSSAAPSNPIHPIPSRAIDGAPNSSERPPSRSSGAAAPMPSSVRTLTPPSAPGDARAAMFPPAPEPNAEIEELVDQVCQGNLRAVQDLARIGAASVPQVMARFPGPVISERAGPSTRASECGPLLQALAAIGSPALPSITLSSGNDDPRVRRWATLLLGEMPGPEACRAVVQRLADDVPRVHQAALDAARLLLGSSAADLFRKTLFEVAEAEDAPLTLRLRTLEHVAKLKDSASVPRLISFLAADMEPIVHKALWALTVVTRHDFGRDAGAWTDFWDANQSRHRLEWLIDALDHRDPRLRKAAADELRDESGELFGYAEDLPRPERSQAQQEFRRWWQAHGASRRARP